MYKHSAFFGEPTTFSKLPVPPPKPGIIPSLAHETPVVFEHETCAVFIDADLDVVVTDTFTLESGWSMLSNIIRQCLLERKPGHDFGGSGRVGNGKGYFVAVGVVLDHEKVNRVNVTRRWKELS